MIEWKEEYSIGISIIDKEHKELIRIMNAAMVAKQHGDNIDEISKLLKELTTYALKHFSTEESYMIEFNYPEFQYHKEEHHDFSRRRLHIVIESSRGIIIFQMKYLNT